MRPLNSFASGGSRLSGPPGPARRSSGEDIVAPDQPQLWLLQYAGDECIALIPPFAQLLAAIDRRIYRSAKLLLDGLQRLVQVGVCDVVADDHYIDVARRRVALLCHRTEYE